MLVSGKMKMESFVLAVCLLTVASTEMNNADINNRLLKRLFMSGEFARSESNTNINARSGSESSGSSVSSDTGNESSTESGSGACSGSGESSGEGGESSGSGESSGNGVEPGDGGNEPGSGSSGGSDKNCFGIGNKDKLENLSDVLHWMSDEYSNSVLEEDFSQLQSVQELIAYLIVVEEHREYAEGRGLERRFQH